MKQIFDIKSCIGKTIAYADNDEQAFIRFTDDTFLVFETEYDSTFIYDSNDYNITANTSNYNELFDRGLIEVTEFDKWQALHEQEKVKSFENQKANDLRKLAELKAKYPNA